MLGAETWLPEGGWGMFAVGGGIVIDLPGALGCPYGPCVSEEDFRCAEAFCFGRAGVPPYFSRSCCVLSYFVAALSFAMIVSRRF